MLVARLLGLDRIPGHPRWLLDDLLAGEIGEPHAAPRQDHHLLVVEKRHVSGVLKNRRDVGGDEPLVLAEADDDRRAVAHRNNFFVIVCGEQDDRKQPAQPAHRAEHRVFQAVALRLLFDQVRDDLGVGLGDERVPLLLQLFLQLEIVLDDAVVDDHQAPAAVAVRVSVLFSGAPVRRPTRMAEAVDAVDRIFRDDLFEVGELAGTTTNVDETAADDGDAGRIVAAIFEPPQPFDQNRDDGLGTDVTDDAAHDCVLLCQLQVPSSKFKV